MSVINQMLVDLERRRASGEERNRIPDHVRALPGAGQRPVPVALPWVAAALAAVALLVAALWFWQTGSPPVPVTSPTAAPVPAAARTPAPAAEAPAPPVVESFAGRLSLELSQMPGTGMAVPESPAPAAAPAIATAAVVAPRAPVAAGQRRAAVAPVPVPQPATAGASPEASRAGIDKQVRELTPRQRADAEYARGATALHQGSPGVARAAFEAALAIDATHHAARQALVGLLLDGRRQAEAVQVLQDGLRLSPGQHGFAMLLARLQVETGELDAGVRTLERSLDHPGAGPDYLAFYAGLLQRQQKHAEAVTQFQRALSKRGNVGVWLLGLGLSLEALGRGDDAQEAYRRARASGNLSPELQSFADQRLR